jgi:hypothetical protein
MRYMCCVAAVASPTIKALTHHHRASGNKLVGALTPVGQRTCIYLYIYICIYVLIKQMKYK